MYKPLVIGICGGSGSGKTSFIRDLIKSFSKDQLTMISQDNYYRPKEEQKVDKKGIVNFDLPTSIDREAFASDLAKVISGHTVSRKEYTFNNDKQEPKTVVYEPCPILLVEGLFIFQNKRIRKLLDIKIFLHAKENLKVVRRIKRDRVERNYPLDDVLYRYENHVLPSYEKYILPFKEKADVVINNNKNYNSGIAILKGFLTNHLNQQINSVPNSISDLHNFD